MIRDNKLIQDIICRGIRRRQAGGVEMAQIVFFKPTKQFIAWAKGCGLDIIDCGAGIGEWLDDVDNAFGIDYNYREGQSKKVLSMEASLFPFEENHAALLTRPCHGDWVDDTLYMALIRGARAFYAGKHSNVEMDLEGFNKELVLENAGEDGESLWEVKL